MLFNSLAFAIFLPIVFILYWFVTNKSLKVQNTFLLISSYFFYSFWDWRFLFLLMFSTFLDYFTALKIYNSLSTKTKKIWLGISVIANLGFLGFFKYYNFFSASAASLFSSLGFSIHTSMLSIILPLGISFYTFHGLSYVFDIYNGKIKPADNLVDYSLFVSFFPLLVAGPIERATHLLPQVQNPRKFDYSKVVDGLRQILWGVFKKVVIADNCAQYANIIFNNSSDYSGTTLLLGAVFFSFQIYGDFSGYADIAIGTARLLGFELLRNFAFPYFSRDIAEFWRRWHISLTSWFRDYLYIPLGGSKCGIWKKVRNIFIIFLISGFWHGANWSFIVWGALNAIYIIPLILVKKNRDNLGIVAQGKLFPSLKDIVNIGLTFLLTTFAWIFFRAANTRYALEYIENLFKGLFHKSAYVQTLNFLILNVGITLPVLIVGFILIEWFGREQKYAIENIGIKYPKLVRWSFYYSIVIAIFFFTGQKQQFIYFQF